MGKPYSRFKSAHHDALIEVITQGIIDHEVTNALPPIRAKALAQTILSRIAKAGFTITKRGRPA